jgi:hypothetical protein
MQRFVSVCAIGVLALVVAWNVPVAHLRQTCVVCRLHRSDRTCLGLTRSTYSDNECSRWYAAHVEPQHAHTWERSTCVYESNLLGISMRVGCRPGRYPICLLDPSTQLGVYRHFKDPLEAKKLFEGLTDAKTYNDRLDEDDEDRGHLTVGAIREWESAGFPGTWGEWWSRFYAKHVEEHKEWLTWLHADSDLNFSDWQKQRKKPEELTSRASSGLAQDGKP